MSCLKENDFGEEWVLWEEYSFSIMVFWRLYRDKKAFKKDFPHVPIRKNRKNKKRRLEIYI